MKSSAADTLVRCEEYPGLVVFDIDGTLTDTVALHQAAFLVAMQSFDFPSLNQDWSSYRHHTDSGIFAEAWEKAGRGKPSAVDWLAFSARLELAFERAQSTHSIREIPGAAAFIALLQNAGWRVGYATGGTRALSLIKLRRAGISFDESCLVTASEHITRDEIVGSAIAAATGDSAELPGLPVSIGDGPWDLTTARNLGLRFLGVGRGLKARILTECGATVVPDFSEPARALEIMVTMTR